MAAIFRLLASRSGTAPGSGGRRLLLAFALAWLAAALPVRADQPITLHGAVQFADEHPFNQALLKFEELTKKYYGKPINFVLHRNSELGLEKDYFAYMNQGISVDYAIVSPSHMSTFAKSAPLISVPRAILASKYARATSTDLAPLGGMETGEQSGNMASPTLS